MNASTLDPVAVHNKMYEYKFHQTVLTLALSSSVTESSFETSSCLRGSKRLT